MTGTTKAARVAAHVPQSARDNYSQIVLDQAAAQDRPVADVQAEWVTELRRRHASVDPVGGYDHIADWLEDADLQPDPVATADEIAEVARVQAAKAEHALVLDGFAEHDAEAIQAHRQAVKDANSEPASDEEPTDGEEGAGDDAA